MLELAIKIRQGKLRLTVPLRVWVDLALDTGDFTLLPVDCDTLIDANDLPGDFHSDPGDRISVASARQRGLIVATKDQALRSYSNVRTLRD